MDYRDTLNLPETDFPMRGNLPQREPQILARWQQEDVYKKVQKASQGRTKFILHDGPPYANGDIHLGHALNKVLKDIIIKYKTMQGFAAPYVPGWDTHGLPIEQQVIKKLGLNRHAVSALEFRARCREYALKYVQTQSEQFQRLGVRGDWAHPYLTLEPDYEAAQIGVFGRMAEKGYIYKGLKPVYWCPSCETALAEAEIEYADKTSPAIFVKFSVRDGRGLLPDGSFVVIWTTTPWTLPANVAISLHPEYTYVMVRAEGQIWLVAEGMLESLRQIWGMELPVEQQFLGRDLEGILCVNPLLERDSVLILGEHVTLEQGTGCVHTAPGHGEDDFIAGKKYELPVICPVDHQGKFTAEGGPYQGLKTDKANLVILEDLQNNGVLIHQEKIKHSYPHCWRCKNPIIFRATEQWFASIDGFRQEALTEIDRVRWIPAWGRDRIYNMVADRGDWCISRQRTWGVPIPMFYCAQCGKELINSATIAHLQEIFAREGSDAWFAHEAVELLPKRTACSCGGTEFLKESDIMDVWFDSGSSHVSVLQARPELSFPADLYLEGSDQHRGWFNSSLSTAVAVFGEAPYHTVLTHGFLVDEQGRKMSKSGGNGVDPLQVIKDMGADILRLWVASSDYRNDVAVSHRIMKQMTEAYRKIRNTLRFLIGNLNGFAPERDRVAYAQLEELDRWALTRLAGTIERVRQAYENYEFHVVYHTIHNFCTVDLSAVYLDIVKDRLYVEGRDTEKRRAAQTVLYECLNAITRLIAPILTFTADEVWPYIPGDKEESVQLADLPDAQTAWRDVALTERWERILALRSEVSKALEQARQEKLINHPLTAQVELYPTEEQYGLLQGAPNLAEIFIVSAVQLHAPCGDRPEGSAPAEAGSGLGVRITSAPGEKCERCWMYHPAVGADPEHPALCPRCLSVIRQGQ
ncbi:MAG: isoleucine--tRNA ligase [Peptococcaceae bacterium]|jgi:isoleucyl-tRNA synthetase|nr:isoleucine--tRNA ligase [Peptococcaceae bacterium]